MYTNKMIDLCPYLPAPTVPERKHTLHNVLQIVGTVVESIVTIGIGVCLITGTYIFLSIV